MCTVAQHRLSHLERSRCPVFEAENAPEALQVLELSKACVSVVLLDGVTFRTNLAAAEALVGQFTPSPGSVTA
jgi:hypothetical protein